MRTRPGSPPARLLALLAGAAAISLPVAGAASTPVRQAGALERENAALTAGAHSATLELFALESRLSRLRARLAALSARSDALRRDEVRAAKQLGIATRALEASQRQLANRLSALYQQDQTDPVAVLLGAQSLDEALTRIDDLDRTATLNASVIQQTRTAKRRLVALRARLKGKQAAVARHQATTAEAVLAVSGAAVSRRSFLVTLATKRRLNTREIARLQSVAREVEARARAVEVAPAASASEPAADTQTAPGPAQAGRTLTVLATGYALRGRTATGMPTGWGVVAVDPAVIPLGTRMTIPGYGEGVAADIGGSIRGATIDLWFPSAAEAFAWGRRTVTVTLH